ncbi:hypothetical protein GV828_07650 [Flavobacterium sp. NST-5]|uniref:Chemotaxis methyl-accepting receptor HlyB-like 4HB MCP domain-containing protein n=1 Tax=Flavobacterium ichthyis TaxID=2698827 RepID=A0ABW9Z8M8_9FLAO|nr:hypothetical protein [Flavobacterium ichthyis]NBL65071.1 hypothetical protein [Flavobacterium ichthyis]
MKTIRQFSKNKFFASFLALVMGFSAVYAGPSKKTILVDTNKTGEEIFKEILFLDNNELGMDLPAFRDQFELLRNLSAEQQRERRALADNIVNVLKQANPNYFRTFKTNILSDNPYTIAQTIHDASNLVIRNLSLVSEFNEFKNYMNENGKNYDLTNKEDINRLTKDLEALSKNMNGGRQALFVGPVVIAVALAVVAVAAIAYVVFNVKWGVMQDISHSTLEQDMFITQVMRAY